MMITSKASASISWTGGISTVEFITFSLPVPAGSRADHMTPTLCYQTGPQRAPCGATPLYTLFEEPAPGAHRLRRVPKNQQCQAGGLLILATFSGGDAQAQRIELDETLGISLIVGAAILFKRGNALVK